MSSPLTPACDLYCHQCGRTHPLRHQPACQHVTDGHELTLAERRQFPLATVHSIEVVDEGLDLVDGGVRSLTVCQLPGKCFRDPGLARDLFEQCNRKRPKATNEGLNDLGHAPLSPRMRESQYRIRDMAWCTIPNTGQIAQAATGMTSMDLRAILAANLKAHLSQHPTIKTTPALERATAARGLKVGKSTIDRALKHATPINLDYLEVFAEVFGVESWQLLVDPASTAKHAPSAMSLTEVEAALVESFRDIPPDEQATLLTNTEARARHYRVQLNKLLQAKGLPPIFKDDGSAGAD